MCASFPGGKAAFLIAVLFSAFQLVTAIYPVLPSQIIRAMHVGFLLLLGFALLANLRATSRGGKVWFWSLGVAGFLTGYARSYEELAKLQRATNRPVDAEKTLRAKDELEKQPKK